MPITSSDASFLIGQRVADAAGVVGLPRWREMSDRGQFCRWLGVLVMQGAIIGAMGV